MAAVGELIGKAQLVQMMGNVEDVERGASKGGTQLSTERKGPTPARARVCVHHWHNSDNSKGRCVWERCHGTLLEEKN